MAITHAQFVSMFQAVGALFREALFKFGRETATNNVIALAAAVKASAQGDFSSELASRAAGWRGKFAGICSSAEIKAQFDPVFRSLLRDLAQNRGNLDPASNFGAIIEYFRTGAGGPYTVKTRGITFDLVPTVAGSGNGQVFRLTIDRYGNTIEGVYIPLSITLRCITADADAPGEEVFEVTVPGATDILDRGSPPPGVSFDPAATMQGLNSDGEFLGDASFQIATAAVPDPTDLGSWVDPTGVYGTAKYAIVDDTADATAILSTEELKNGGKKLALEIKGNHTIQQELDGLDLDSAYFWALRVKPLVGLTAGTMTIQWGSTTFVQNIALLPIGAYALVTPLLNSFLWARNFAGSASNRLFRIIITGLTGANVRVDAVRLRRLNFFGGTYWTIESDTVPFQVGSSEKTFKFDDVLATVDSVLQQLVHLGYGTYLPASGAPNVPDPP